MPRNQIVKLGNLKYKKYFYLALILFVGLAIRIFFIPKWVEINGDMLLYKDWAVKFQELGTDEFYTHSVWYYAPPNYPPILSLIYGTAGWLYERKYVLAQLHNFIKIPPAFFIIYFYDFGLWLLLKSPAILSDILISLLIFNIVFKITGDLKKSYAALLFYIFNPVSIFLSGIWGQTDSLVSLIALVSFVLLIRGKTHLSLPLYFISLYTKPNWLFFVPLYLFLLVKTKPGKKNLIMGFLATLVVFIITTYPFAKADFFGFSYWLLTTRILPTAMVAEKLSVSAFNFYTIFFTIDKDLVSRELLGIRLGILGWLTFSAINIFVFKFLYRKKITETELMWSLFTVGFGGFLFLPNMLERYFFPSFIPMVILMFSRLNLFLFGLILNFIAFLNILWAFFRRSNDRIGSPFTDNNFLIMRLLSIVSLSAWLFLVVKEKIMLQSKRG